MRLKWDTPAFVVTWRCYREGENTLAVAMHGNGGFRVYYEEGGKDRTLSWWSTLEKAKQFCQDMVDNKAENYSTGDFQPTHDWSGRDA